MQTVSEHRWKCETCCRLNGSLWHCSERRLGRRFVAAVSASCSGDKSDKEESAGDFVAMGIVAQGLGIRCTDLRGLWSR
jgi:hypothetical protein